MKKYVSLNPNTEYYKRCNIFSNKSLWILVAQCIIIMLILLAVCVYNSIAIFAVHESVNPLNLYYWADLKGVYCTRFVLETSLGIKSLFLSSFHPNLIWKISFGQSYLCIDHLTFSGHMNIFTSDLLRTLLPVQDQKND